MKAHYSFRSQSLYDCLFVMAGYDFALFFNKKTVFTCVPSVVRSLLNRGTNSIKLKSSSNNAILIYQAK